MAVTVYGIPNCDTTKKALALLKKHKTDFSFYDYKQQGISKEKLQGWIAKLGLETIFNKRSTTWKELPAAEQKKAGNETGAIQLMMQHNSIIKRPVIEIGDEILAGFNETAITKQLK